MLDGQAPLAWFDEIDSTLLEARRRAERGDVGPTWLLAGVQTAGRGRRGRAWSSIEGNLHATYLFATDRPPAEIALLSFAAGVAIAETIEAMVGAGRVALKWPNDVFLDRAKVSGILIDSGALAGNGLWAALAFGVNIARAPEALDQAAICLRDVLPADAEAPAPRAFFASLRPRLESWAHRLVGEGFAPLRTAWLARAYGLGEPAVVKVGDQELQGRIAGLSARGELEFDTPEGRRLISAGDVFFPQAT